MVIRGVEALIYEETANGESKHTHWCRRVARQSSAFSNVLAAWTFAKSSTDSVFERHHGGDEGRLELDLTTPVATLRGLQARSPENLGRHGERAAEIRSHATTRNASDA